MTTSAIKKILAELGIPSDQQGYSYIFFAISLLAEDPLAYTKKFTTNIYPEIASCYNTTSQAVQQAIRRTVKYALTSANSDLLHKILGIPENQPLPKVTCTRFLLRIAEYLQKD